MQRAGCICGHHAISRRAALALPLGLTLATVASGAQADLPPRVAGIALPQTNLAARAAALSRSACPDFLFNHAMRTYLFGALYADKHGLAFNAEAAFVAAALHDFGLLPRYASSNGSFETDGARAGEEFARQNGMDAASADAVWRAIAMHDTRFSRRQGPEATVVAVGAGTDVNGPGSAFTADEIAAIVAAFPRLQFKSRFTALLVDQCQRKPLSQEGTWLEGLCRETSPNAWPAGIAQSIAASQFSE